MPDPQSQRRVRVVPSDVLGSWKAMLEIFARLEETGRFFDWDSTEEYRRHKAQKSQPMATLLNQLSCLPLSRSFRIGAGLYGIGVLLPYDETRKTTDSRMVALNVSEDRQIEITCLDISRPGLAPRILERTTCDLDEAAAKVVDATRALAGTKIPMPTLSE